jgi:deoxyribonuclease-4
MLLGSHVSIAGGLHNAFTMAQKIGCTAIQIFTKNANRWQAKPLTQEAIEQFLNAWKASEVKSVSVHDSYLINLGTPKPDLLKKSQNALLIELQRCEQLQIPYLVMHPGSHVGSGEEEGLKRVVESFDIIHEQTPGYQAKILVETTAGQGSALGYRFEHLAHIRAMVREPERIGVCLDTCHIFAAGYDFRAETSYQSTMDAFDSIIGLQHLKVIHLNDSLKEFDSRVDRHEEIGKGQIGLDGFRHVMRDPRLKDVPKILETPKAKDPVASDQENLRILRKLMVAI